MRLSLITLAQEAKKAAASLRDSSRAKRDEALLSIADTLAEYREEILAANQKDLAAAEKKGLSPALMDRLSLQNERLEHLIKDVLKITQLPDPLGEILEESHLPNGLHLLKKRVPIGVLGVIYEARPNVTVDIAALCIKTGNCALLRGGSETLHTNKVLVATIQKALSKVDLPAEIIQLIAHPSRAYIKQLLQLDTYVDMIIPRGGATLQRFCVENSTIPVITGGIGICHLFVEKSANLERSIPVIVNAKTSRPSVCNSLDTLLVESAIASPFLSHLAKALQEKGVSFRLDPKAWELLQAEKELFPTLFYQANEDDWKREWMSLVLGIKVVESLDEALEHIAQYGSGHSDGILTESPEKAAHFVNNVDSAALYINASTRFTDGGEFGFGAEVAVSTQKLHARGPMALKELTSYKWIATGNYSIRS